MATTYPDWAQTWANAYGVTPAEIMANVGKPPQKVWRESGDTGGYWDEISLPGSDINPATGRRYVDEQMFPQGTLASDFDSSGWVQGPNHIGTGGKILSTVVPLALGAMAGYGALGAAGALGANAGSGAGAIGGAAPGEAAGAFTGSFGSGAAPAAGGAWGITDPAFTAWNAMPAAGAAAPAGGSWGITDPAYSGAWNSVPAASSAVPAASKSGSIFSQIEQALGLPAGSLGTAGQVAGAATGGQSNTGGLLGAGLGGLLGYLDAKSQPDSLTIKNEIDPRLAAYAYGGDGTGGVARSAFDLMNRQLNSPNPLTEAGKQISGMANNQPSWEQLSKQNQSLWGNANPWIEQQQKSITDLTTRNLMENVIPGIGSSANMAGGYGGSRQGIMQGKAISDMNTNLAPALTSLASNAYENAQNRAMTGTQAAGSYGLQNQAQQAGLIGTGANLQQSGAWSPIQNMTNVMGALPGNTSQTQPLFNNPWAGALGGASLGSQVGGSTNWSDLFKNIGSWNWPFGSTSSTGG